MNLYNLSFSDSDDIAIIGVDYKVASDTQSGITDCRAIGSDVGEKEKIPTSHKRLSRCDTTGEETQIQHLNSNKETKR